MILKFTIMTLKLQIELHILTFDSETHEVNSYASQTNRHRRYAMLGFPPCSKEVEPFSISMRFPLPAVQSSRIYLRVL